MWKYLLLAFAPWVVGAGLALGVGYLLADPLEALFDGTVARIDHAIGYRP